ncbi:MAG: peptidoglycan-binding domain-containing protein [Casimicrobium sp.]
MAIPLRSPRFTDPKCAARFQKALNNTPTIKRGETNQLVVRRLQQALIDDGIPLPNSIKKYGSPDGDFGQETFDGVRNFQLKYFPGVTPDGKVGKHTLSRLDDLLPYAGAPLPPLPASHDPYIEDLAMDAVINVLSGPFVSQIDFVYRGQAVNVGWFAMVKSRINAGHIKILYEPSIADTGLAVYYPQNNRPTHPNTIGMPNAKLVTWKQRSVLLHECVHASQDLRGLHLSVQIAEGAAFIAQNLYHRMATGKGVTDTSPTANAIHVEADKFAVKILAKNQSFSAAEILLLDNAIVNAGYSGVVAYDGVPSE